MRDPHGNTKTIEEEERKKNHFPKVKDCINKV
jgi:hypothetical protein